MFVERRLVPGSDKVEIWECEWEYPTDMQARKRFLRKIGDEQPLTLDAGSASFQPAICWSYGRTLANIAVFSPSLLGHFPNSSGEDALLPCDFVSAGKFRHGKPRWWCRTHQTHWGTKADQQSYAQSRVMFCSNHDQSMNYVVGPFELNVDNHYEVAIGCSLPPAISTRLEGPRAPMIQVSLSAAPDSVPSTVEHSAISLVYQKRLGLFANTEIARVNITPPAALEFVLALEAERTLSCISCSHCGYPHLDLGDFARKPHRKHFCANCGRDSTWSKDPIVSTPLKPLYDQLVGDPSVVTASGSIDLAAYAGCDYSIWATTPAVLWTSRRPQVAGVRVQITKGATVLVDDVFVDVVLDGMRLERDELLRMMLTRTIV